MNRVMVGTEKIPLPQWAGNLKRYVLLVLDRLGMDKWDLSVMLCDDETIKELNSRYRGRAQATDVLSFAQNEGEFFPSAESRERRRRLPGDIVISLDSLRDNACRFRVGEDEELRRLLIHGILHLDGMNHESNKNTEPMLRLQEQILTDLTENRIIGRRS